MSVHQEYLKVLLHACKLRFPHYPAYYFPIYAIIKLLSDLEFQFRTRQLNFKLIPISNRYFDFLCSEHQIQSEHTVFCNQKVFDYYCYQKDVNFVNLTVTEITKRNSKKVTETEKVLTNILEKSSSSNNLPSNKTKMTALYQVFPLSGIPINKIFIKENSYYNFIDKYKLNGDRELKELFVNMSMLSSSQKLPQISSKANIFLINPPYDVSTSFIDEVLSEYFKRPQLLYRNHTYVVDLTETRIGNFLFCENFHIISKLKTIHFKCVHLESSGNPFDMFGIVMKNLTNLHQMTSINYPKPRQLLNELFYVTNYPFGLEKYFQELKSTVLPFVSSSENAKEMLKERKIFPVIQILGDRGSGKRKIVQAVADSLGMSVFYAECCDIVTSIASQTESKILYTLHRATACNPLIICFNDFEFFGKTNEGHEDERVIAFFEQEVVKLFSKNSADHAIIIIALVNGNQPLKSTKLNGFFLETIQFMPLDKEERFQSLLWYHQCETFDKKGHDIKNKKIENYINNRVQQNDPNELRILRKIAEQTQGFILADLRVFYQKTMSAHEYVVKLDEKIFDEQLIEIKKCFSDSIGTPDIPKVLWDDIGGLANLKKEIQNSIGLPLKFSHLMGKNMKRSGILLFGPPGTGKTLVAKAVATECNLSFISVQGPELLNMYVGQSEQNVREVFSKARAAAPCVIFLDELDSLAPNRGVAGDSGGVMDRVVSQLLSEMDGVDTDPKKPVFILAATNRPDLIDKQLLRPGRFDKMLYVGPCVTAADKELVIKALTKKFNLKKELSSKKIAELVTMDVTGADLYSVCSNAWLSAVRRQIHKFNDNKVKEDEVISDNVTVNLDDFKKSLTQFVPSLNQVDMAYFKKLESSYS